MEQEKQGKSHRITIRLTDKEKSRLTEQASMLQVGESEYVRLLLTQKPFDYPEVRKLMRSLIYEINQIGSNINQIAKRVNMGCFSSVDKVNLFSAMRKLRSSVDEVVKLLGNQ